MSKSITFRGALHLSRCLDMNLQNGSILCNCSKASNLSIVSGFGVVVDSWEILGEILGCGVEVTLGEVCCVQLLVLKTGPSAREAVSMLTDVDVEVGFNNQYRQSAALFLATEIHSKVILYVASSRLHLLTLLLAFLPFRNCTNSLRSFLTVMSAPCRY